MGSCLIPLLFVQLHVIFCYLSAYLLLSFFPENLKKQRLHESHQMAGAYFTFFTFWTWGAGAGCFLLVELG
jgi:hypothetical protein